MAKSNSKKVQHYLQIHHITQFLKTLGHFLLLGVLYITYSMLIGESGNGTRLNQIVCWFGEKYDGLIVFDESHKAKNLLGNKPTQMGAAVLELQRRLPKARVVYCSATGASEPINMCYMDRLGTNNDLFSSLANISYPS